MFNVGDVVEVVALGPNNSFYYTDGEDILGQKFTVLSIDPIGYIQIDYNDGWWVRQEALAHVGGKTSIERKIAFMYSRWEKRHV